MDDIGDAEYYADAQFEARMCQEYGGDCKNCPCKYDCDGAEDFG